MTTLRGTGRCWGVIAVVCLAATWAGQGAAQDDSAARWVRGVDWSAFSTDVEPDALLAQAQRITQNGARYCAGWVEATYERTEDRYLVPYENVEHVIRPPASVAAGLAMAVRMGLADETVVGYGEGELTALTARLIKGMAAAHKANGGAWGDHWQSAIWSALTARGAWLLWDDLDAETREMAARMLFHEADRHLAEGYRIPYWNGEGGDSKAEENSWESMPLVLAAVMAPDHPNAARWREVASALMVSAYSRPSDQTRETPTVDGKPPAAWLDGYNIREDGIVINHGLIHNDYMTAISHCQMQAFLLCSLARRPAPESADFNFEVVYRALVTHVFDSPPYEAPGGTMYIPGSPEQYYPQGTDWSRHRFACFYNMDTLAHVLGADRDLPHRAADWLPLRAERMLQMQRRHADGRMYADGEFDRYPGREQMVFWMTTDACMMQWLAAQDAVSPQANWLAEDDARAPDSRMAIEVVSPRRDLLFTDAETPEIAVRITGAPSDAAVTWRIAETESEWTDAGALTMAVQNGAGEALLPLALPGRGHFTLTVEARADGARASRETMLGVVFAPREPDPDSPWGLFHIPTGLGTRRADDPGDARAIAQSFRRLGASWARLNFWSHAYGAIDISTQDGAPLVTADIAQWKAYARALRDEGISIMGEIAQCPTALSSQPDDDAQRLDMGRVANRVRPRDYAEWEALMTWLAAEFRDEISVWEIWNEPDFTPGFWVGTPEEFAELVIRTATALRRGNPDARIAGCGFVHAQKFADRLFELGVGEHLDILSVHYTDGDPDDIAAWQEVLDRHGLDLPIWNTEERSEIPFDNLAAGIERSFNFLHIRVGSYDAFRPLVNPDLTPRPAGIWYAVGAHCLGDADYTGTDDAAAHYDTHYFARGDERIAAFQVHPYRNLFGPDTPTEVTLQIEPLDPSTPPMLTDRYGRSRPLVVEDGRAAATLDSGLMFLNGARSVSIISSRSLEPGRSNTVVAEAESGEWGAGWGVSDDPTFSGGRFVQIWAADDPGEEGYAVRVPFDIDAPGRYDLYFSGNPLTRLGSPASISAFSWRIDDGPERAVREPLTAAPDVANAGQGLFPIGQAELAAGPHAFTLTLTDRRESPDERYALWFDAVILHRTGQP